MIEENKELYESASEMLEVLIIKLQHRKDYKKNRLLGQILAHYLELHRFKADFHLIEKKFTNIINSMECEL